MLGANPLFPGPLQARAPAPFHWMRVHTGLHARNSGCYVVTPLIFGIIIYNYPSLGTHAWVPLIGPFQWKGPDTLNPNGQAIYIYPLPKARQGKMIVAKGHKSFFLSGCEGSRPFGASPRAPLLTSRYRRCRRCSHSDTRANSLALWLHPVDIKRSHYPHAM